MKFKSTKQAKKAHSGIFRKFSPFMPILPIKKAFTLAELLMATLVMSIILTALAPVMTKRTLDNVNIGQSRNEKDGKLFLYDSMTSGSSGEMLYEEDAVFRRDSFTVPADVFSIDVYIQSAGGGGGKAMTPSVGNGNLSACKTDGRGGKSANLRVVKGMYDFKIKKLVGAGGGGGGGSASEVLGPDSQQACDSIENDSDNNNRHFVFIPGSDNDGYNTCATRSGPGEGYVPVASGVSYVPVNGSSTQLSACFYGKTSSDCKNSGCNRVVCTFPAADASCNSFYPSGTSYIPPGTFALPTGNQLRQWFDHVWSPFLYKGKDGFNACAKDVHNESKWDLCKDGGGCWIKYTGVNHQACRPNSMWGRTGDANSPDYRYSSVAYNTDIAKAAITGDGAWYSGTFWAADSLSSRCALVNNSVYTYRISSGGGGGGGAHVSNRAFDVQPSAGWEINIRGGAPGICSNGTCSHGQSSYIDIYTNSSGEHYSYDAPGGITGTYATSSAKGTGGKGGSRVTYKRMVNGSVMSSYLIGSAGAKGGDGSFFLELVAKGVPYFPLEKGGAGGSSYTTGAPGGSDIGASNALPTDYGAGGGGGAAQNKAILSSGYPVGGEMKGAIGSYGGNGCAEVIYTQTTPRPTGGGGGGGAFALLQGIPVQPGFVVEVYVGAGGGHEYYSYHNGGRSGVRVINASGATVVEYILSGGGGGEFGEIAYHNGRNYANGGDGGREYRCVNCGLYKKIYRLGTHGSNSSNQEYVSMNHPSPFIQAGGYAGGNGGASGVGTNGGYGGYYIITSHGILEANGSPNGRSVDFKAPSMIFGAMDYGNAGAGGGGGGWNWGYGAKDYKSNGGIGDVGDGAKGQDGYVFIMWDKPPES